ncbi:MAG TPA: PHP domain-containing protein [Candidatus Onthousia excrementipullorum]|uniref:PHP domain-containing protein n=1 Tax=Candidatus Onthousia excrementipullorum TaxID=2840884 RepID=A0A9D1DUA4_9FIRM|nr:PHP domain-containing protein [Candidatus Onthousia excrementipullorum]
MIDLHMHTTYSDGTDTVKELLEKAESLGLEVISITDHNTCKSYFEMEEFNVKEIYKGDILVGCEFTTSFDNRLIEVLGYGFDYKKVNKYLEEFYSDELVSKRTNILYNRLLDRIKELGLEFHLERVRDKKFTNEFFERGIYEELVKYENNKEKLKEDVWASFSNFYRKGLTNPKSKLFINHAEFKPSIKEIVNLIHKNGGIAFLAHPYQYKFTDTEKFLDKIYDEVALDGIECFYTTFSEEQTNYLLDFAKKKNLLISGGSDYHGTNKENHNLGVGRGNLKISKDIINNYKIGKYYQ